jgi:hypothetical protein
MKLIQLLKEMKYGILDEISSISIPSQYNIDKDPYLDNLYHIKFELNQYKVEITIS